jgi:sucrose-6-phosphate hydrolase SacC (GH32 family)
MPPSAWTQTESDLGAHWKLDGSGDEARELQSGTRDAIPSRTGHARWVGEGRERALRLDGYSVWIHHPVANPKLATGSVTFCAWVALEAYPVHTAALVQSSGGNTSGYCLCIDQWGYPRFGAWVAEGWKEIAGLQPVPRGRWVHLAGALSERGAPLLFMDGEACEANSLPDATPPALTANGISIGRARDCPVIGDLFPTGVINGLIKDVRIYAAPLSAPSLARVMAEAKPAQAPDLEINGNWCGDDPSRPHYHAMPPRAWTNEPHGLVHFNGQYHLFYQKNANGPYWGNINWGHLASPDLRTWTELPVALTPDHGADAEGCWSGSVIEHEGKLAIFYTGNGGRGAGICLATSSDGVHFTKHAANPVIAATPDSAVYPEFRDPFVWREQDRFYLLIGSAVKGRGGTALLYRSDDLVHWEFRKPLLVGDREKSGIFWEMPIFVKVGDRHVLIVCEVPGRASYWVGDWKDEVFTPLAVEPHRLELFNHLLSPTPHVTGDGQVITMGIIPDQRSPKQCWRWGWAHLYSLPRRLSIGPDGRLQQSPWEGLSSWASDPVSWAAFPLRENAPDTLRGISGTCLHLHAVISRKASRELEVVVRRSPDDRERTVLRYQWEIGRLILDRTKSSLDPEVKRELQEATYFPRREDVLEVEIYLDVSVVEVFLDGRAAFATRVYPTLPESEGLALVSFGGEAMVDSVTISRIPAGG